MKAARQPQASTMAGMIRGVTIAPMLVPALNRPVAKARSFLGNHSAMAFTPPGKAPPSPTPRATRAAMNPVVERAKAFDMCASCQIRKARPKPNRAPSLSITRPKAR